MQLPADAQASQISTSESGGDFEVEAQVSGPEGGDLKIVRNLADRKSFTTSGGGGN